MNGIQLMCSCERIKTLGVMSVELKHLKTALSCSWVKRKTQAKVYKCEECTSVGERGGVDDRSANRTAIPGYRLSIENVELSSPVKHNASPDKNSRTTVMVSFLDVTGIKPCPDLSPNQNALRLAYGTESTLIRKEDTTQLISCPDFVLSAPL
ncbi:uncharacterized protein TNCV_4124041 [Trichonephila clavipes]|nr:uncharacterized protein TNCV_4124041 [Trichonephila clavipes]